MRIDWGWRNGGMEDDESGSDGVQASIWVPGCCCAG